MQLESNEISLLEKIFKEALNPKKDFQNEKFNVRLNIFEITQLKQSADPWWGSSEDMLESVKGVVDGESIENSVSVGIQGDQIIIDLQENQDLLPFILNLYRSYGFNPIQKPGDNKSYVVFDIPRKLQKTSSSAPGSVEVGKNYIASYTLPFGGQNKINEGDTFTVTKILRPAGQFEIVILNSKSGYGGSILLDSDDTWDHKELI